LEPVLLYDGDCGFCSSVVRFVLENERTDTLRFAALKSPAARRIIHKHNELDDIDSVVWVDRDESGAPERILVRSAAALRLARYLGGGWRLLAALWIVPRPARDFVYDLVARNRHRVLGRRRCVAPTADTQHRFLG
jgi:predicted DCC family thiol-disulfide oxidoreductase YuxK